jgi:DNA/RNA endonuclease YhcR with UshA esterase domain
MGKQSRLMFTLGAVAVALAGFGAGTTVQIRAHHAFGAEFDPNRPVLLRGPIVRVEWVNPHTWIHVEVTNDDGTTQVWMVEGGTPNTLLRRGLTRDTIQIGAVVVVDGYQSKDRSARANGRDVTFEDGSKFFLGSSGTGAPRDGRDPTEPG